jgi:predicted flap endonuclease-1-like 5' DNA nuclease
MGLSEILTRIKTALGIGGSRRQQAPQRPPQQGHQQDQSPQQAQQSGGQSQQTGTNVTVEREPSTESEDAVKGTDTDPETTGGSASEETAQEPEESDAENAAAAASESDDTEAESAEEEPAEEPNDDDLGTDESTDVIKGIGSAYADRLSEAGIETVADLAHGDAESLSEETGISEKRLQNWIDRAKHR